MSHFHGSQQYFRIVLRWSKWAALYPSCPVHWSLPPHCLSSAAEKRHDHLGTEEGWPGLTEVFWTRLRLRRPEAGNSVLGLSVVTDSLRPHGLWPARLLCTWDFSSKDIAVGCHLLLQEGMVSQEQMVSIYSWCSMGVADEARRTRSPE